MVNVQYTNDQAISLRGNMQTQTKVQTSPFDTDNDNCSACREELALDTAGLRRARQFARLVLGTRSAGDLLLSQAIDWVRLQYRHRQFHSGCFVPLVKAMRMLVRLPETGPDLEPAMLSKPVMAHLSLPLEAREAAALSLLLDGDCLEISALLCLDPGSVKKLLDQSWGSRLVLLACTAQDG